MKKQLLNITLLIATAGVLKAQVSFSPAVNYSTDSGPIDVVSADFNNDGKMDLATANLNSGNFSVLLNNGNGTYTTNVNYTSGSGPNSLCAADFNEDGNIDLAIANKNDGLISTHFGAGDGTFTFDQDFSPGWGGPIDLVSADFNNDGNMDIASSSENSEVVIIFGNGLGQFSSVTGYPNVLGPEKIFTADFNNDGLMDIVNTNKSSEGAGTDSISVLLNLGSGTFSTTVNYWINTYPNSVISADFNGDNKMDIATVNYDTDEVSVLLGNGNGTFNPAVYYSTNGQPSSLTFGDFNLDGKIDIATSNQDSPDLSILLGSGSGSFAAPVNFALSSTPASIITNDFNLDGKMDLALTSRNSNNVSILLNSLIIPASALNFNAAGSGNKVVLPSAINTILADSNQITVEAWVKPTSLSGFGCIIGNYNTPNNQMQFLIRRQITEYGFWIGNTGSYYSVNSTNPPSLNTWEHVAMTYNGTVLTAYVNGVVVGTLNISYSSLGLPTNSLVIGGNNSNENFAGEIDEVRIWNRSLCKGEIVHNMNIELPDAQPGLIAYYKFNQGYDNTNNSTVTSLADSSGNGYDGTLTNFTLTGTTSNWVSTGAVTSGITATEYTPLGFTGFNPTNVTCNGGNDGAYNLMVVGGTPAYTYAWSNGANTTSITSLSAGSYTLNVTDAQTCKATWTVNITEPAALDNTTNTNGVTITANATGVSYQWIDCNNGNAQIAGATNQAYTATSNGSYAVVITSGPCSDTSACVSITTTGIKNNAKQVNLLVYPNPTNGIITISSLNNELGLIQIQNSLGQIVYNEVLNSKKTQLDLTNLTSGVYFLINHDGLTQKLIITNKD